MREQRTTDDIEGIVTKRQMQCISGNRRLSRWLEDGTTFGPAASPATCGHSSRRCVARPLARRQLRRLPPAAKVPAGALSSDDLPQQNSCRVRSSEPVVDVAQVDQACGDLRGSSQIVVEPFGNDFALHVDDGGVDRRQRSMVSSQLALIVNYYSPRSLGCACTLLPRDGIPRFHSWETLKPKLRSRAPRCQAMSFGAELALRNLHSLSLDESVATVLRQVGSAACRPDEQDRDQGNSGLARAALAILRECFSAGPTLNQFRFLSLLRCFTAILQVYPGPC